ncbi:MAG: hypothetical protein HY238_01125 [Acidobacteria bacterium]|nr:hypothetical protein [Acidobacteriota bacterium]
MPDLRQSSRRFSKRNGLARSMLEGALSWQLDMISTGHLRPRRDPLNPDLFIPHPNLDDAINRNICQSEIEGGVFLDELGVGAALEVETRNRRYRVEKRGDNQILIHGHAKFCPDPVVVELRGSTWGGSMMKEGFIGRGMRLEFRHPSFGVILTSRIKDIRECVRKPADVRTGQPVFASSSVVGSPVCSESQ